MNLKNRKNQKIAGMAVAMSAVADCVLLAIFNVRVCPFRTFVFLRTRHVIKLDDCGEKRYWEADSELRSAC